MCFVHSLERLSRGTFFVALIYWVIVKAEHGLNEHLNKGWCRKILNIIVYCRKMLNIIVYYWKMLNLIFKYMKKLNLIVYCRKMLNLIVY